MDGNRVAVVAAVGVAGAIALPLVGMAAGALVPWAMSTFGTVVPGVGTVRAADGVADTLQYTSVALVSAKAAAIGAAIGAAFGWRST